MNDILADSILSCQSDVIQEWHIRDEIPEAILRRISNTKLHNFFEDWNDVLSNYGQKIYYQCDLKLTRYPGNGGKYRLTVTAIHDSSPNSTFKFTMSLTHNQLNQVANTLASQTVYNRDSEQIWEKPTLQVMLLGHAVRFPIPVVPPSNFGDYPKPVQVQIMRYYLEHADRPDPHIYSSSHITIGNGLSAVTRNYLMVWNSRFIGENMSLYKQDGEYNLAIDSFEMNTPDSVVIPESDVEVVLAGMLPAVSFPDW